MGPAGGGVAITRQESETEKVRDFMRYKELVQAEIMLSFFIKVDRRRM